MKKTLLTLASAMLVMAAAAQQKPFIQTEQGATYIYKIYDDKDKESGSYDVDITSLSDKSVSITNTISMGEEMGEMIICEDYNIADDAALIQARTPRIMFYNPNVSMSIIWCTKDTPGVMTVGLEWPVEKVAQLQQFAYQGKTMLILNMESVARTVVAKESVTVPADTYEAYKTKSTKSMFVAAFEIESGGNPSDVIAQLTKILSESNGDVTAIKTMAKEYQDGTLEMNEWYAAGVGLVKSETLGKKGEVISSVKLAAIE